jgi:hypothetical protein
MSPISVPRSLALLARSRDPHDGCGGAEVGGERARRKKSPSSLYISVTRFADGDDSVVLRMDEVAQLCEGKAFLCWIVVENL